jgi:hypothetical protein
MFQEPPTPYYSAPELIAIITTTAALITGVIASVANLVVTIRTGVVIKQSLKENTDISAATFTKAAVIEGHVNSERTQASEQLQGSKREIEILRRELTERNQAAALLAASTAQVIRQRNNTPNPAVSFDRRAEDRADATLAQIEENTKATAAGIQELKGEA